MSKFIKKRVFKKKTKAAVPIAAVAQAVKRIICKKKVLTQLSTASLDTTLAVGNNNNYMYHEITAIPKTGFTPGTRTGDTIDLFSLGLRITQSLSANVKNKIMRVCVISPKSSYLGGLDVAALSNVFMDTLGVVAPFDLLSRTAISDLNKDAFKIYYDKVFNIHHELLAAGTTLVKKTIKFNPPLKVNYDVGAAPAVTIATRNRMYVVVMMGEWDNGPAAGVMFTNLRSETHYCDGATNR